MTEYARFNDAEGMAALGICESILLALTDLKIISQKDARDLLTAADDRSQPAATMPASGFEVGWEYHARPGLVL